MTKPGLQTTWRGATDAWECDQMGHMNVQFYGQKFDKAEAVLLARLGLPAGTAGRPETDHIIFKAESRVGAALHIESAVIGVDHAATRIRLRHEMYHSVTGALSASIDTGIAGLPGTVLTAAEAIRVPPEAANALPEAAAVAGADGVSLRAARERGLTETLVGIVEPGDLRPSGLLTRKAFIGRLSESVAHLISGDALSAEFLRSRHIGSAALDYKLRWVAPVAPGDIINLRSAASGTVGRTLRFFHWMVNETTGEPIATVEIIAVYFDMKARKAIAVPDEIIRLFEGRTVAWPG